MNSHAKGFDSSGLSIRFVLQGTDGNAPRSLGEVNPATGASPPSGFGKTRADQSKQNVLLCSIASCWEGVISGGVISGGGMVVMVGRL